MRGRIASVFAAAVALSAISSRADQAWDALKNGLKEYSDGNYTAAATNFDAAGMAAQKEKLDPAVPAFDRANALLKSGKAKDAAQAYEEALRTTDLGLQSKAYHNRGNAMLGIAGEQEKTQKFEDAIKSVDEAMTMYERSMVLAPKDADPKINYELAGLIKKRLEEELKQQQQQQQQNKDQNQDQKKDQNKDQQKQDQDQKKDQQQQDKDKQQQQDQQKQDQQNQQQQQQQQDQQASDEKKDQQQKRAEQMTPQEAAMMLDAMKDKEQAQREKMGMIWLKRSNAGKMQPVDKDW